MLEAFLTSFRANRQRFRAHRAPAVRVAEAKVADLVRIEGQVEIDETELVSPFARTRCVAYAAKVDQKMRSTVSGMAPAFGESTYLVRRIDVAAQVAFWLVDDAGDRVRVREDPATSTLGFVDVSQAPTVNGDDPEFVRYMRSKGVIPTLFMGVSGEHIFEEGSLAVGARASVFGRVVELAETVSTGYRDGAIRVRDLPGTDDEPLVIRRA